MFQQKQPHHVDHDEGRNPFKDRDVADAAGDGVDHVDVHTRRRRDKAQFDRHDDDAEPHRIKTKRSDHRKNDRNHQDDHRHRIQKTSHHKEQQ